MMPNESLLADQILRVSVLERLFLELSMEQFEANSKKLEESEEDASAGVRDVDRNVLEQLPEAA